MNATDIIEVGLPLPRISDVWPRGPQSVVVTWTEGPRSPGREVIDLRPDLLTYRIYRPLRSDPDLFATVHVIADGAAIAWGDDDAIDMPATSLERLAEETMTSAEFSSFLARNGFTYDAAAAELGISRRLVAYYASGKAIPRYIALACRYLDGVRTAG
jgi:hypothetical protein